MLLERLGLALPIFQAPMAGVSSPAMAAAVSEAGGLGALGVGAMTADAAAQAIAETRARTDKPFNVNLFVHAPAQRDAVLEAAWIARLQPQFAALGAEPPAALAEIYTSFATDDAMLAMLLEQRPAAVSLHFGLPDAARLAALRNAGILLLATATSPAEAQAVAAAGIDAVVAQGYEAGGHRGIFDPAGPDERLATLPLVRLLVRQGRQPVVAAGGIMDGAGIAAALALGAEAAQLGTAYIACDESLADAGYRAALARAFETGTAMTAAISGRPARCLANRFTALAEAVPKAAVPAYPVAYDLGKALNAAGKAAGEAGFGAQWAGQGAALARPMPAGALTRLLVDELRAASSSAIASVSPAG